MTDSLTFNLYYILTYRYEGSRIATRECLILTMDVMLTHSRCVHSWDNQLCWHLVLSACCSLSTNCIHDTCPQIVAHQRRSPLSDEPLEGSPSEGHPVNFSANTASSRLLAFAPGRLTCPPPLPAYEPVPPRFRHCSFTPLHAEYWTANQHWTD